MTDAARQTASGAPLSFFQTMASRLGERLKFLVVFIFTPPLALTVGCFLLAIATDAQFDAYSARVYWSVLSLAFFAFILFGWPIYVGMLVVGLPILAVLRRLKFRSWQMSWLMYGVAGLGGSALFFLAASIFKAVRPEDFIILTLCFGLPAGLIARLIFDLLDRVGHVINLHRGRNVEATGG